MLSRASANLNLRKRLETLCQKNECELLLAPLAFCSDNALMIARAGREKYLKKEFISHDKLTINPRVSFKKRVNLMVAKASHLI